MRQKYKIIDIKHHLLFVNQLFIVIITDEPFKNKIKKT